MDCSSCSGLAQGCASSEPGGARRKGDLPGPKAILGKEISAFNPREARLAFQSLAIQLA